MSSVQIEPHNSDNQIRLFKGNIILNKGISALNFFALILHSCFPGVVTTPLDILLVPLMKNVYHLNPEDQATAISIVQATHLITKLLVAPSIGFLCDKYGRKIVITTGMVLLLTTVFLTPYLPSFYPYYILLQIVFEIGLLSIVTIPLLADYVDDETKGRAAGIICVLNFFSSAVSVFLNRNADLANLPMKFIQIGMIGCVLAILIFLSIKSGPSPQIHQETEGFKEFDAESERVEEIELKIRASKRSKSNPQEESEIENPEIATIDGENIQLNNPERNANKGLDFRTAMSEIKKPWILISFLNLFLMMSSMALLGFPLISYLNHLKEGSTNQVVLLSSEKLIISTISAIFFGFFADKYNRFKLILLVVSCSIIGALHIIFLSNPESIIAHFAMFWFGISSAGFMTTSYQQVSKFANAKYRASVLAVGLMFSFLGSGFVRIFGTALMHYNILFPYYLYLGCALAILVVFYYVYVANKELLQKE